MQDKDLFNGVIGRYTDHNDENGATKKNNDMEITKTVEKPRKSMRFFNIIRLNMILPLNQFGLWHLYDTIRLSRIQNSKCLLVHLICDFLLHISICDVRMELNCNFKFEKNPSN